MIVKQLKEVMGSNAKKQILKSADTFDKQMFICAYHPDYTYGVKYNYIHWVSVKPFSQLDYILLNKLRTRELSGNAAREAIKAHCDEHGDLVKLICNKDLDCGVNASILNSVFGKGFIPIFEIQKALEVPMHKVTLPMLGQLKYNGVRVVAHVKDDDVIFRTSSGKPFEFPQLKEFLQNVSKFYAKELILDGELTFLDSKGTNHTKIGGIVNSALKGTPVIDHTDSIVFHVFDSLHAVDFCSQVCNEKYQVRLDRLKTVIHCLHTCIPKEETKHIQVAITYNFNTHDDIAKVYQDLVNQGYEGLILKSEHHLYTFTRSEDWIKLKETKTADLVCVGVLKGKGSGKYSNSIGSLVLEGIVEGKDVTVEVGSGLSDSDREKEPSEYLHNIIEVEYNSVIRDSKTGRFSLFLPRFVIIRGDK